MGKLSFDSILFNDNTPNQHIFITGILLIVYNSLRGLNEKIVDRDFK